ncbi:SDR family NAD(P)-dependent oxidoreductase [Pseudonocardia spirodelae]|uniref:SDR family NAD(P)-dependent oxidoreductase n=1 Tax=Pseudonocardia spirodelae TaxID=3133431 RepID=A0ABU8TCI2_9PSEU
MTVLAIVGAGPGLGAAVARRFGREGFEVALLGRRRERAEALAAELTADGVRAHGFAADARDPAGLAAALERVAETVGPVEVLQYSPAPQKDFLRPLLETTPADLVGPVEMSVYGPVAAVHQVLPGMRALGRGTVLFVNGGSGARPAARVAGTSIAFAGTGAFAAMLHDEVARDGVHVAQLIVPGAIEPGHPRTDPAVLAETLWTLHRDRPAGFRHLADEL